jgi:hypothetical protein
MWKLGFMPRTVHMGIMVDKVALEQVFLQVLQFFLANIIPPGLHTHISSGGSINSPRTGLQK